MRPSSTFSITTRPAPVLVGFGWLALATCLLADAPDRSLPLLTVYSQRVANQAPVATFAMPVSALRFEPRVDVQARNFAEGQADIAIRGGIFENTGFTLGAVTLFDPQTGHYFAEIPVAPAMLGAPQIVTGADLGLSATNATVGSVLHGWRPIRTAGAVAVGAGQDGLTQGEFYQGYVSDVKLGGRQLAADVAWAHSDSDGSVPYGDHVLNRVNARLQLAGAGAQTDLFAGYQAKFFGWPNLYTPFNSNETDDLETILIALNHRRDFGGGDFFEAGAAYRRNKDEYVYNRLIGPVQPYFRHTTWVQSAALSGRQSLDAFALNYRAEAWHDELKSTSLIFGRFNTRQLYKLALVPEWSRALGGGAKLVARAGASYDDTNRGSGELSPILELARESSGPWQKLYLSYAKTSQVPTYTALNSSAAAGLFRGNPDLGRETSHNLEAGAQLAAAGWRGQAAVFYRRDDDLVDWTFRRGVTARTASAVDIATTGFEVVAQRSWQRFDVVLGYTWLTKDADYGGALVDASFYALNYARQRLTAAVTARLTREIELRLDNEVRVQAANLLRTRGGDHPLISSLGVTYRPAALRRLSLSVQVDNLWDSTFQEVPAVPAARRQTSFSAGYTW
ncbi:TonB-dependent receptor plug domain-containing protein [Opitutus terrae]|uniref:TonB-dependent receptor n=1 Tax=Opitutus terrae (strain DSM 11246 / JCM 15787 / PB90-1) TaxID=452637 RepID=B1ZVA3_OPITP|nr:TonB-dependent receptor [Opitutus terrae]ACB76770.1 TonB-dependent receptor [Opitutus terrae PB90-1]